MAPSGRWSSIRASSSSSRAALSISRPPRKKPTLCCWSPRLRSIPATSRASARCTSYNGSSPGIRCVILSGGGLTLAAAVEEPLYRTERGGLGRFVVKLGSLSCDRIKKLWLCTRPLHRPRISRQLFQQLAHRPLEAGVTHLRCDFGQRLQYKSPLMHGRVRHLEIRSANHGVAKQQDVDVDNPRAFGPNAAAAHVPFNS